MFIPDLQASGAVWDTTVIHLRGRVQSHVLSVAGFAGQPPIDGPLLRKLHDDLALYIREEGLKRPVLVGHMFGATVAYWLAMSHPDLIGGLVAIDCPPSRPTGDADDAAETEEVRRSLLSATPQVFAAMVRRRVATMVADPILAKWLGDAAAKSSQQVVAEAFYEMATLDLHRDISKIRAPVLVLLSTENVPRESWADYESRFRSQLGLIEDHELVIMNGARHYVMLDSPEEFFRRLDGFLATH